MSPGALWTLLGLMAAAVTLLGQLSAQPPIP